MESINTDTSNKHPPEYMGVKYYYHKGSPGHTENDNDHSTVRKENRIEERHMRDSYKLQKSKSTATTKSRNLSTTVSSMKEKRMKLNSKKHRIFNQTRKEPALKSIAYLIQRTKSVFNN